MPLLIHLQRAALTISEKIPHELERADKGNEFSNTL